MALQCWNQTSSRGLLSFTFLLALLLVEKSYGWMQRPPSALNSRSSSSTYAPEKSRLVLQGNVDSVSLKDLGNHEEEGQKMAKSIAAWLDAEWMPQEVHERMAEAAKNSYIKCREAGDDDLMLIMTTIADDLTSNWAEYDKDAFVGAWDISNYVSDYLVQASGQEGCDCSIKIH